ncbi:HD family phosphohydrolase [Halanaerobium congolense]|jgi:hypothetical protein|uniref:HD domain-containing protein n=1 Tax=Halanaerobium congolense TaxID=54121 RepID=A0A1G6NW50_9FIRM|nr:HD family phosphohydrolase [Halanaerobium congolense]KXS48871.1 MAG: hypothetical protein AWL62_1560 [Halanaerobium sp. T82-1]PUU91594.1 MAG: hypothetical protein CI948_1078 [Halanaerobium sp.]PTX17825.1 hypothetical protein C7953_2641 [Halanaerobium congolense]TDP19164.1 hypothetical protein C8C79_11146 [Halanaerobium congolense]TDS29565.1 hypothetical protein BY453_11753 [Halanaerobium congolense]
MKEKFIADLKKTGKNGIEDLLSYLKEIEFYDKPASIRHHLNVTGGLLEHTENVKKEYLKLNEEINAGIPKENMIIQASIHDLEKCFAYTSEMQNTITEGQNNFLRSLVRDNMDLYNTYGLDRYVENKEFIISKEYASDLIKWFKDGRNIAPPDVRSDWNYNENNLPLNHSMRAILEASKFIELDERDVLAITYHMGPYGPFDERKRSKAEELYPDVRLLHLADSIATKKEDIEAELSNK